MNLREFKSEIKSFCGWAAFRPWEKANTIERNAQACRDMGQINHGTYSRALDWAADERRR